MYGIQNNLFIINYLIVFSGWVKTQLISLFYSLFFKIYFLLLLDSIFNKRVKNKNHLSVTEVEQSYKNNLNSSKITKIKSFKIWDFYLHQLQNKLDSNSYPMFCTKLKWRKLTEAIRLTLVMLSFSNTLKTIKSYKFYLTP